MDGKGLLLSFAGLIAAVVVVTGVASALHSDDETGGGEAVAAPESDGERCAADEKCEEPDGGATIDGNTDGGAFGICIEGTADCVDTPLTPSEGGDDPAVVNENPDEPVSNDVDPEEPLVDEGSGSGSSGCPTGAEPECAARATELALSDLADRLGVDVDAIVFQGAEATEWSNACLGIETEGILCAEVITPGFIVTLAHAEVTYVYHADEGNYVLLAE